MNAATALLEARAVSKSFGGLRALDQVSLSVEAGEILGLIGPNGAGKTTLFNCLNGQLHPDKGTVVFDGVPIDGLPAYRRARLGMSRTFQRVEIFPEMSVRDHMIVADRARHDKGLLWRDLLLRTRPKREEIGRADEILAMVGLGALADEQVGALGLGLSRLVEIGRALAGSPRLLMADEPSSGLDVRETTALGDTLQRVRASTGLAIVLVEHDLDMVARVVDRVVALDFGHQIASGSFAEVLADPAVRGAYLGKSA